MKRIREKSQLGQRWLQCGWRLFKRGPALLLGMGLVALIVLAALSLIPFAGGLVIALVFPLFFASTIMVADDLAQGQRRRGGPLGQRLLRPLKSLFRAFDKEQHAMAVVILCVYTVAIAILINILAYVVSGGAWVIDFTALNFTAALKSLAAWVVALVLYAMLMISLIFSVPLVCLQGSPLMPAIGKSLQAGRRRLAPLLVLLGLLIVPLLVGAVVSYFSAWATYVVWVVGGSLIGPLFVTSSYCSYRTLFQAKPG